VNLRECVCVLRRGWQLTLICAALGLLFAGMGTLRGTRMYAATVTMVVSPAGGAAVDGPAGGASAGTPMSERGVRSYANLVASDRIAAAALSRLHVTESVDTLRDRIVAQVVPHTLLLRVSVRDPNAARAERLADAVGTVFSAAVAQLEAPGKGQRPATRVSVWEGAKLPAGPVAPRPARDLALGGVLGLLAGLGVTLARHRFDSTLADEQAASAISGGPALGSITFESSAGRRPLIVHGSPLSPRAEAFRRLRANLRYLDVDGGPGSIVVTSAVAAEGRSTTTCNLAITLASSGSRVCLVEGDLRRPSFPEYLGVERTVGLTSVLIGAAPLDDALAPWGAGRLGDGSVDVLPGGPTPPNPGELIGSRAMADLIHQLTDRYDVVLIDAPPLLAAPDAAVLAGQAGGALLVCRAGRTRRAQVRQAVKALRKAGGRILGTVLTMAGSPEQADDGVGARYRGYLPRGRRVPDSLAADPFAVGTRSGGRAAHPGDGDPLDGVPADPSEPVSLTTTTTAAATHAARR